MVGSTQDVAREAVAKGTDLPALVVAQRQSIGRGSPGPRWVHPPGGLAFTVAVQFPPDAPAAWPTMAAALGAARAIETHTGVALGIKWPNDLVHGGRKVGGVLAEAHGPWSLVGVGLNVNAAPGVADGTPTVSLAEIGGGALDLTALLIELVAAMLGALAGRRGDAACAAAVVERPVSRAWGERVFISGPDGTRLRSRRVPPGRWQSASGAWRWEPSRDPDRRCLVAPGSGTDDPRLAGCICSRWRR